MVGCLILRHLENLGDETLPKRIGEEGFAKTFAYSSGEAAMDQSSWHLSDATVQENFTSFPTDAKLCQKVTEKCHKIAEKENIRLRRSYTCESKQCLRDTCNDKHPKRARKAKKALKRLQTIVNTQLRDLECKMTEGQRVGVNAFQTRSQSAKK